MKLISLNVWGGKLYNPLLNFIKEQSQTTDIFCLQEVFTTPSQTTTSSTFRTNLYEELQKVLNNHQGYFSSTIENYLAGSFQNELTSFPLSWGLAIFVNKKIHIESTGDFFVFGSKGSFIPGNLNTIPRKLQYVRISYNNNPYSICNIHGIWVKGSKKDTKSRINQSNLINQFLAKETGKKILVGDFNLDIDTQSLKMLEENMLNLIKEYNIPTTRNSYFPGKEKFADYAFVSKDVTVKDFAVPNVDASDHLPLILEFS